MIPAFVWRLVTTPAGQAVLLFLALSVGVWLYGRHTAAEARAEYVAEQARVDAREAARREDGLHANQKRTEQRADELAEQARLAQVRLREISDASTAHNQRVCLFSDQRVRLTSGLRRKAGGAGGGRPSSARPASARALPPPRPAGL